LDEQQSCFWLTNSKAAFCICSNDASAMFWCMANISWCLNNISRAAPWFGTWLTFVAMLLQQFFWRMNNEISSEAAS
jgi:hypothetical protein